MTTQEPTPMTEISSYPSDWATFSIRHEIRTGLYIASVWRYQSSLDEPELDPRFDFRRNDPGATVLYHSDPFPTAAEALASVQDFIAQGLSSRIRWQRTREADIEAHIAGAPERTRAAKLPKPSKSAESASTQELLDLLDL